MGALARVTAADVTKAVVRDFGEWRTLARTFLREERAPERILWTTEGPELSLFGSSPAVAAIAAGAGPADMPVPREFLQLARTVAQHRDPARWALLYGLLWALRRQPRTLEIATDPLVHRASIWVKQVRRDIHKMEAFVRFERFLAPGGEECFLAWYEPDYAILESVLPFFVKRFGAMNWVILTPDGGATWDQTRLTRLPGPLVKPDRLGDEVESLWRTYYAHIFNPARVKVNMMKREMPVRFWKNLPEAQDIPGLLAAAPARARVMIETARQAAADAPSEASVPGLASLPELRESLRTCRACDLCTLGGGPAVFGEGAPDARFVLVGEQPGDQEDRQGRPFVGPAGQLLHGILREISAPYAEIYFTNAVKHFRFEVKETRRMHKGPSVHHVKACRNWLGAELRALKAERVLCLGATAAQSVLGYTVPVLKTRGQGPRPSPLGARECFVTLHPSAVLRARDEAQAREYREYLKEDLRKFFAA